MFGRRRKGRAGSAERPSELMLGTDFRAEIRAAESADDLARVILQAAQQKAEKAASGEEVIVELTEPQRHIHYHELMLSLMTLAGEHGLRAGSSLDNRYTFIKL